MRLLQVCFCIGLCSVLLLGCSRSGSPVKRGDLEVEFEEVFGFKPSPQVVDLRCEIVQIGDCLQRWLTFKYDKATEEKILKQGFTVFSDKDIKRGYRNIPETTNSSASSDYLPRIAEGENPNEPPWWPKPPIHQKCMYVKSGWVDNKYGRIDICFWVDEETKTMFVIWLAVD